MLAAIALSLLAGFVAGVIFHKYVISEAEAIKEHVTNEVTEMRADLMNAVKSVTSKL